VREVVVESVALCPESIVVGATKITGAAKAPLTVTVAMLEVTVCGVPELSVTSSSKLHVPAAVSVPVEMVGRSPALQPNEPPRSL
jgi:hypothetical protein